MNFHSKTGARRLPADGRALGIRAICGIAAGMCLAFAAPLSAEQANSGVDSIVAASGSALGTAALANKRGVALDGSIEVLGIAGTSQEWQDLRSGDFASSVVAGPVSGDNGYDGTHVWNRDPFGVVWDDGSRDAYYGALEAAYVGSYALWKPHYGGATVTLGTPQSAEGRSYDVLTVTPRGGLPFDYWIDAATHLPYRTVVPIGIITTTTTFTNYRTFDGLQVPATQKQESVQGASVFTVKAVRFDAPEIAQRVARPQPSVHDFSIAGGGQASVPFDLVDNHVVLDVSIDGKGPFRFILDTGGNLVIDNDLAKSLRLGAAGSMQGLGVGSGTDTFNFTTIDSLDIGGAHIGRLYASVAPIRTGFGVSGGEPVDGLIGFETLARFVTTFDYPNRRLTFRLPGSPPVTGGKTSAFVFNGTDPMLPCRIASADGTCTVDTGSRSALDVYGPFAKVHPGLVTGLTADGIGGFGVGGPAFGQLGRTSLDIGGYEIPNIIAGVSSQEKGAFADPFQAGNVGGAVWRRFAVTFDYPHETITLVPGADFSSPEAFDHSGLFLISQKGSIVVAGARAGTPAAAAGVKPGEAIVSIDGKSTSTMSLKDARDVLMGAQGTTCGLVVAGKDGATRTVTFV
jgi:hypothetical protein